MGARVSDSDGRVSDMDRRVTVAACQFDVADLDVDRNLDAVTMRVGELDESVDVALFPEYALTGFVADDRIARVAVPRDGEVVDRLRTVAAEHECGLLVGFVERSVEGVVERSVEGVVERSVEGAELYNAVAYVRPSGEVVVYRKRNLWEGERAVLTPGTDRVVVETPAGRTGLLTCYDLNHVDASAAMTDERVDTLFVAGAWPATHAGNWRLLCRARALDGLRYVVAAGRTGRREVTGARPTQYAGRSMAVRPDGSVMAAINRTERDVVVTLDPAELAEQRSFIPILEDPGDGG